MMRVVGAAMRTEIMPQDTNHAKANEKDAMPTC